MFYHSCFQDYRLFCKIYIRNMRKWAREDRKFLYSDVVKLKGCTDNFRTQSEGRLDKWGPRVREQNKKESCSIELKRPAKHKMAKVKKGVIQSRPRE